MSTRALLVLRERNNLQGQTSATQAFLEGIQEAMITRGTIEYQLNS